MDVAGITCVRAVVEVILGRGLKMVDMAGVFCWGKSNVSGDSGCFAWDGFFGPDITISDRTFKTMVPALLGMCSYTICWYSGGWRTEGCCGAGGKSFEETDTVFDIVADGILVDCRLISLS